MRMSSWKKKLFTALLSAMMMAGALGFSLSALAATSIEAANIRATASTDANLLGVLYPGQQALVLDEVVGMDGTTWYHIEVVTEDGVTINGYVKGSLLTGIDDEVTLPETEDTPEEEGTLPEEQPAEVQEPVAETPAEPAVETTVQQPVPEGFDPMTDPAAHFEMRYKDSGNGTGSWYAYNTETGREFALADPAQANAETAQAAGTEAVHSGWRMASIVLGLIALAVIAILLILMRRINEDRRNSKAARAERRRNYFEDEDEEDLQEDFEEDFEGEEEVIEEEEFEEETEEDAEEDSEEDIEEDSKEAFEEDSEEETEENSEEAFEEVSDEAVEEEAEEQAEETEEDNYYRVDYSKDRKLAKKTEIEEESEAVPEEEIEEEVYEEEVVDEVSEPEEESSEEEDFEDEEEEDYSEADEDEEDEDYETELFERSRRSDKKNGGFLSAISGFFQKVFASGADEDDDDLDEDDYEEDDDLEEGGEEDVDYRRREKRDMFSDAEFEDGDPDDFRIFDDHNAKPRRRGDEPIATAEDQFEDELRDYPEDADLLPRDDADKAWKEIDESGEADWREVPDFEEETDYAPEKEQKENGDKPGLPLQKVMRNVRVDEEDAYFSEDELDDDLTQEDLESVLFDEDDDDMEYSFLRPRRK